MTEPKLWSGRCLWLRVDFWTGFGRTTDAAGARGAFVDKCTHCALPGLVVRRRVRERGRPSALVSMIV